MEAKIHCTRKETWRALQEYSSSYIFYLKNGNRFHNKKVWATSAVTIVTFKMIAKLKVQDSWFLRIGYKTNLLFYV